MHIDAHWVLRTFGMQASMEASMRVWTRFLTLILVRFDQGAQCTEIESSIDMEVNGQQLTIFLNSSYLI